MHLFTAPPWILSGYAVVVGLLALWRGGWAERAVGAALIIEFVTQGRAFLKLDYPTWYPPAWDVVILATCVTCALRGNRYWTVAASSFALLECMTGLGQFVPGIGEWAVRSGLWIWNVLLVSSLLAGVWSAARARAHSAAAAAT